MLTPTNIVALSSTIHKINQAEDIPLQTIVITKVKHEQTIHEPQQMHEEAKIEM